MPTRSEPRFTGHARPLGIAVLGVSVAGAIDALVRMRAGLPLDTLAWLTSLALYALLAAAVLMTARAAKPAPDSQPDGEGDGASARLRELALEAIFQNHPDGLTVKRVDGLYVEVNPSFERLVKKTRDDIIGHPIDGFWHGEPTAEAIEMRDRQVIESGEPKQFRVPAGLNTARSVQVTKIPVREASGRIVGLASVTSDRTEALEANEQARESQAMFEAFFEEAPEVLALKTPHGVILKVNRAFEVRSGLSRDAVVGQRIEGLGIWDIDALTALEAQDAQVLKTGDSVTGDVAVKSTATRPAHFLRVTMFPVHDAEGSLVGLAIRSLDITEQVEAAQALEDLNRELETRVIERTSALEAAQAQVVSNERFGTIGRLTASISHELRNPLATIQMSLTVLEQAVDVSEPQAGRALARARRSIDRCVAIIKDLMTFTEDKPLVCREMPVDDTVANLVRDYSFHAGVRLSVHTESGVSLDFDADCLRLALHALLENAHDALVRESGDMVEDASIEVSTSIDAGRVDIRVRDNGTGLSDEARARAFEPLFSTKGFGVGLGLPLAKRCMERLSGGAEITDTDENWTAVTLWLPLRGNHRTGEDRVS